MKNASELVKPRLVSWLFGWLSVAAIFALSACAAAQYLGKIEHGFAVENKGDDLIRQVSISYGGQVITFCETQCYAKRTGSFYGVYMPIQDEMLVTWKTADGTRHEARVPVKSRVKDASRLSVLFLEFGANRLKVRQGMRYTNPGLVGIEEAPLYP